LGHGRDHVAQKSGKEVGMKGRRSTNKKRSDLGPLHYGYGHVFGYTEPAERRLEHAAVNQPSKGLEACHLAGFASFLERRADLRFAEAEVGVSTPQCPVDRTVEAAHILDAPAGAGQDSGRGQERDVAAALFRPVAGE
jgi:hypothetical protein